MPPDAPTTATLAAVALVEEKERAAAMAAGRRAVRAANMVGLCWWSVCGVGWDGKRGNTYVSDLEHGRRGQEAPRAAGVQRQGKALIDKKGVALCGMVVVRGCMLAPCVVRVGCARVPKVWGLEESLAECGDGWA